MRPRYIFEISFKNLMNRKSRSILTISGVTIGVAAVTFLVCLGYGFQRMTTLKIASPEAMFVFDASIEDSDIINIDDKKVADIKNMPDVIETEKGVMMASKAVIGNLKTDILLYGYNERYIEISDMKIFKGENINKDKKQNIVVSTALLKLIDVPLNSYQGQKIGIDIVANSNLSPTLKNGDIKSMPDMVIAGVVDDDRSAFAIAPFDLVGEQASITNYNQLKVKVSSIDKIMDVRRKVEEMGLSTNYIGDTLQQIDSFFKIFRYIVGGFGFISMVIAIIGMFNTLTVSLLERTKEIGILKSSGATRRDIWLLFLSESLIISLIGGAFGILMGVLGGEITNLLFNIYAKRNGAESIDFFYAPILFLVSTVLAIGAVGLLTGLYPSKRATTINPLDALKYE